MAKPTSRRKTINPNTVVLIRQIVIGVLIFGFVGGLVMGVWYVTRVPALTLETVRASGGETIDLPMLERLAEEQLDGTYFGLIPRRFVWLYPRQKILADIAAIPRVRSASLHVTTGPVLALAITEYRPQALWCTDVATSTCVFLSETGYAYATAPGLRGGGLLRFVSIGELPAVDEQPWSTEDFIVLQALASILTDAHWPISHIEVDAVRDVFLHITGGGEFKMTLTAPIEESVENLLTVVAAEQFSHLAPGNFQYIDLRFGNRVFVNEEFPEVADEVIESDQPDVMENNGATTTNATTSDLAESEVSI